MGILVIRFSKLRMKSATGAIRAINLLAGIGYTFD
jgi:hypothetical protein